MGRRVIPCRRADAGCVLGTLLVGGGLKVVYDLLLYRAFRHVEPAEEKSEPKNVG
jgi:hypothetical protein